MKIMVTFLSAVIVFLGMAHLFSDKFPLPHKGTGYSIVLIIAGAIILVLSMANRLLMGLERLFLMVQSLLLICVASLPFFTAIFTFLPREGILYSAMIIVIGAIGLLYGLIGMG